MKLAAATRRKRKSAYHTFWREIDAKCRAAFGVEDGPADDSKDKPRTDRMPSAARP